MLPKRVPLPRPPSLFGDPRHYQILVLGGLLAYGTGVLDLQILVVNVIVIVGGTLLTELAWRKSRGLPFDPRSPLISGMSLSLLARSNSLLLLALAAVVTISSKFLIRRRGKHVFNPTNFGLVAMISVSGGLWVSPGQWGSTAYLGLLLACVGGLVVHRAARSDVTYAFLLAYTILLFGRAAWLGDPLDIPLHGLQSGALLIFAFFMISDPKTTPDSRTGRIVFATLVAAGALFVQFGLYRPNGLLWSLVCCAPLVPLIDRWLPGRRYRWGAPPSSRATGRQLAAHPAAVRQTMTSPT